MCCLGSTRLGVFREDAPLSMSELGSAVRLLARESTTGGLGIYTLITRAATGQTMHSRRRADKQARRAERTANPRGLSSVVHLLPWARLILTKEH
jgi:hypothetical protein